MAAVIQGTVDADMNGTLTQSQVSQSVDFCFRAFTRVPTKEQNALIEKVKLKLSGLNEPHDGDNPKVREAVKELEKKLQPSELSILDTFRARQMVQAEGSKKIDLNGVDVIDGLALNLERGNLTLVEAKAATVNGTGGRDPLLRADASMLKLLDING